MTKRVSIPSGVDGIPISTIPTDPQAFVTWFTSVYLKRWAANGDARNAVPTSASVQITGSIGTPAGIGIGPNSITNAELVQRSPLSVMGNPTDVPANVQDIAATADGEFLQRLAGALTWGPVTPTISVADSITGTGSVASPLELVGDNAAPGNTEYYGTDGSGNKGFFPLTSSSITTLTQTGGASQAYSIPASAKFLLVICIGGGGGGNGGNLEPSATVSVGGGGGGGGGVSICYLVAATVTSPVTVSFSNTAGGIGAIASVGPTATLGTSGSNVSFGKYLIAFGGLAGAVSTNGGSAGLGKEQQGSNGGNGSTGGSAGAVGSPQQGGVVLGAGNYACTGGGGGGGTSAVPAATVGGAGGGAGSNPFLTFVGGTAGTAGGGAGGNGANGTGSFPSAGGGGGGGALTTISGGNGGNGGSFGAGGGGGGGAKNTAAQAGAGGNGGPAACIIVAW